MKVKELIAILKGADQEALVVLSKDPEGNGFDTVYNIDLEMGFGWGEIKYLTLTDELRKHGYTEEDVVGGDDTYEKCVVIWP